MFDTNDSSYIIFIENLTMQWKEYRFIGRRESKNTALPSVTFNYEKEKIVNWYR